MFNPHQAQAWSGLLLKEPGLTRFEGHTFETAVVQTSLPFCAHAPSETGHLQAPQRVFGTPVDPSCLSSVRNSMVRLAAPGMVRAVNARVIGFSAVLTEDMKLLAPHEITEPETADFLARNAYNHQGFLFELVEAGLLIRFAAREQPRRIAGRALFLHNIEPGNFGSVVGDRTPWLGEALQLAGLPRRPISTVAEVCRDVFEELLIISGVDNGGYLSQQTLSGLTSFKGRALDFASLVRPSPKRIYVSRRLSALHRPWYRVMLNEAEIEELLQRNGFQIVYPETLSLTDQVHTFAEAQCVIGPLGSGMFNTAFSPEDCRVLDIETFHVTVAQHAMFYSSCRPTPSCSPRPSLRRKPRLCTVPM